MKIDVTKEWCMTMARLEGESEIGVNNMTPAEFEWRDEQTTLAYKRGEIGKITFHRRMSALGFKAESIKEWISELDTERTAMTAGEPGKT